MTRLTSIAALAAVLTTGLSATPAAAQGMPDAKQMSGMPLPVAEMPAGSVGVRVIRGTLANVVPNQPVELVGGSSPTTVKTTETGRAEFSGLTPGTRVKAVTIVDGERLESQEFAVPASGGVRLMLVATDPEAAKRGEEDRKLAQEPPKPGTVVFGDESRFVFELGDDGLTVFTILHVVNSARTPVQTPEPIVLELPEQAQQAGIMEGSSPQATLAGKRLTIAGPFAPGSTAVQVAYSLPYSSGELSFAQTLPVPMTGLTVIAQKVGNLHVTSSQMANHRDVPADGQMYILGQGPALKAGDTVTLDFTGLPHMATWPRNVAVALAVVILGIGAWASTRTNRPATAAESQRKKLVAKRERLLTDLTALEEQHRQGRLDEDRYEARRRELVAALEKVYAELDEEVAA